MSVETRNGRTYLYRAQRVGGKVIKEYAGRGEWVSALAYLERRDREAEREQKRAARDQWQAWSRRVGTVYRDTLALAYSYLCAAGYHQHHRGEWRKRRMSKQSQNQTPDNALKFDEAAMKAMSKTEVLARVAVLISRSRDGDKTTSKELVAIVEAFPDLFTPGIESQTERMISRMTEGEFGNAVLKNRCIDMRKELYGGMPAECVPYAERLIIETVIISYIAGIDTENNARRNQSFASAAYWGKERDRAYRRYLSSLETLAKVRRLSLPTVNMAMPGAVQVNVGDKQMNLSGETRSARQ